MSPNADAGDFILEGTSAARGKKLNIPHVHALTDAPISAGGLEDKDFLAERTLSLFMNNILLRQNVRPFNEFIDARQGISLLDSFEYPELKQLLDSVTHGGVMHEISQWRFNDDSTCYLFKRWRQNLFPDHTTPRLSLLYDEVYKEMREREAMEGGGLTMETLTDFRDAIEELYQSVEDELDPHLKRVWVENQIAIYEKWEGKTRGLPGRLTKDYVEERLTSFRS